MFQFCIKLNIFDNAYNFCIYNIAGHIKEFGEEKVDGLYLI